MLSTLSRAASPARMALTAGNSSRLVLASARALSTASKPAPKPADPAASGASPGAKKSAEVSSSFVQNIFRGVVETEQIFPFPEVLTEDQVETLKLLVPPTEKFMEEVNDAKANDLNEKIADETMKGLAELGGFGLQVPAEYGGIGLTNTQYARITEIVGGNDLGLGITMGAHQSIGFKGILIGGE